jgi:hypothetical protein
MFISDDAYEFWVPPGLKEPSEHHWRVISLGANVPWFIAGFDVPDDGVLIRHTMCIAWERDLLWSIEHRRPGRLVTLQYLLPPRLSEGRHAWQSRDIDAVWRLNEGAGPPGESTFVFCDREGQWQGSLAREMTTVPEDERSLVWKQPVLGAATSSGTSFRRVVGVNYLVRSATTILAGCEAG